MSPFHLSASALLAVGVLLTQVIGCGQDRGAPPETTGGQAATTLTGAGSSFAAPLFNRWAEVYRAAHPGLALSYDSVGSGEGIARFLAGTVDIGATDAPLRPAEAAKVAGGVAQIPVTAGMIAIAYNLPGVQGPLNLPRDVYPAIFSGDIYRWDDPRIAAANPGIDLPHKLIQVVARQDSSGTTFAFTQHLFAISEDWAKRYGTGKVIDWPGGAMVARGNEGVAGRIKITEGSIGYVEAGFASRLKLPLARLQNRAGDFVAPTTETGQRALAGGSEAIPKDLALVISDPAGEGSYPIVTYTFALVRRQTADTGKADATKQLIRWALTAGQGSAEPLYYVPLPDNLVQAALAELDR